MARWRGLPWVVWVVVVVVVVGALPVALASSVLVRNLSGRRVEVSVAGPPGEDVQTPTALRNGSSTRVWTVGREARVVVTEVVVAAAEDAHVRCGAWAAKGECGANPTYMLKKCGASCAAAKKIKERRLEFSTHEAAGGDEYVAVLEDWSLDRQSAARRAAAAFDRAWGRCGGDRRKELWYDDFAECVLTGAAAILRPLHQALNLEASLLARAAVDDGAADEVDEGVVEAAQEAREADGKFFKEGWCAAASSSSSSSSDDDDDDDDDTGRGCLGAALERVAGQLAAATEAQRDATHARSAARRNATCAAAAPRSSHFGRPHAWRWHPAEAAAFALEEPSRKVTDLFAPLEFMPEVRIALVDNFVSEAECDALLAAARPRLKPARVNIKGKLTASPLRSALQAAVAPSKANNRNLSDPIARVKARSVGLANALGGFDLGVEGQEKLMAIQYRAGDEYHLHCDGACDGAPHMRHGRLATVLMYCWTADEGGGTAFPNADVHIQGRRGQALYFHVRAPEAGSPTEVHHTRHSGCPVLRGEKWVVTQWLRDGVGATNHARLYHPAGSLKKPPGDSEEDDD